MTTTITLSLEDTLIKQAEAYAAQSNKSVSQLVADYFASLNHQSQVKLNEIRDTLPPLTQQLTGSLKGVSIDDEKVEYLNHLEQKYL
ncbi:MAG: DUF6364 family protein [Acinetobacter populi]|jgi:uncharacterized protein (DUF2267 family)|uniref:DUF6364 family protein n=1 Tax=Acinetobacter populi TaxID=1582270 RepID=UPI0023571088|nr:DUF6364 family protein [Acinetobacter populi]MCH4246403.1 DUF6364 family protein [Acinetobacter populi]